MVMSALQTQTIRIFVLSTSFEFCANVAKATQENFGFH